MGGRGRAGVRAGVRAGAGGRAGVRAAGGFTGRASLIRAALAFDEHLLSQIRCFELSQLAMKFDRHMDSEVRGLQARRKIYAATNTTDRHAPPTAPKGAAFAAFAV